MDTWGYPATSSASRILATWPSIMPDGATTSAPAAAWETAIRPNTSRVSSLRISPLRTIPQWPWSVYSHRQTSVITTTSDTDALRVRMASWTMPWSSKLSPPTSSFSEGMPKRSTAGMPRAAAASTSPANRSKDQRWTPGMEGIPSATPRPWTTNKGRIRSWARSSVSRTSRRSPRLRRSLRSRPRG